MKNKKPPQLVPLLDHRDEDDRELNKPLESEHEETHYPDKIDCLFNKTLESEHEEQGTHSISSPTRWWKRKGNAPTEPLESETEETVPK